MKNVIAFLLVVSISSLVFSQTYQSPYKTSLAKDLTWISIAAGGTALGLHLKMKKEPTTSAELDNLLKANVPNFDRWAVGNYSISANNTSDIPFYTSFALPFALLLDSNANDYSLQILGLYVESLVTTASLYTIASGLTNRYRPLIYNNTVPLNERIEANGRGSFYSGHVAATATATFFAAKVFSDFNPDSPLVPYIWGVSAAIPALVGYYRIVAGKHFLSDVLLGYTLGAAAGILVPELHKINLEGVSLFTASMSTPLGLNYGTLKLCYNF